MSRVLVTGGAGTLGAAVVRRLLRDPDYEVRVSDQRAAPDWMREGCEIHTGDLRDVDQARLAMQGCEHVVHLAASAVGAALPLTLAESSHARFNAIFHAAAEREPERFVHVSPASVFERAQAYPTAETALDDAPAPRGAAGWAALAGERYCRAAGAERGLRFTICRAFDPYGPGEPDGEDGPAVVELLRRALEGAHPVPLAGEATDTRTPTYVTDLAEGIIGALAHPEALGQDFNLAAAAELTLAEIARLCWTAAGNDDAALALEPDPNGAERVERRWPSTDKARDVLGWEARVGAAEGIALTAAWVRRSGG